MEEATEGSTAAERFKLKHPNYARDYYTKNRERILLRAKERYRLKKNKSVVYKLDDTFIQSKDTQSIQGTA